MHINKERKILTFDCQEYIFGSFPFLFLYAININERYLHVKDGQFLYTANPASQ